MVIYFHLFRYHARPEKKAKRGVMASHVPDLTSGASPAKTTGPSDKPPAAAGRIVFPDMSHLQPAELQDIEVLDLHDVVLQVPAGDPSVPAGRRTSSIGPAAQTAAQARRAQMIKDLAFEKAPWADPAKQSPMQRSPTHWINAGPLD
jgi:hypothetical protein